MLPRTRSYYNPNGFSIDYTAVRNIVAYITRTAPIFGFHIVETLPLLPNNLVNAPKIYIQLKNLVIRARKGDRNGVGQQYSTLAATVGVTLSNQAQLPAVTGFAVDVAAATTLDLVWEAVTGATNYLVQRSDTEDFADVTQEYSGALLTFQDAGLVAETTYYYRIKAQGTGFRDSVYTELEAATTA